MFKEQLGNMDRTEPAATEASASNSLTGDVPTRLSVYDDSAGYSGSINEALGISKIPSDPRTEIRQEERVEVCSVFSDYSFSSSSSYSSETTGSRSRVVVFNNGIRSQQTNVRIRKVTNLNQQQFITDDGTDLLRHTDIVMEDVKCYFDISQTKAWKSVLDTDKIVFLVGFSESFKKLISLKFYQKYKARGDVFRLNSPEDAKICFKGSKPFAIFMEDAFGPFGTDFERISRVIKDLSAFKNLEASLFMMDPLSFERNKESLRKCIKLGLANHVVHLEDEEHLLSEDEKREILEQTSEHVKEEDRSMTKDDIDDIVCFENPIFFDTCKEFVIYNRHDKNVRHFFSLPLDCLVGDIKCLKEKWPDGYYVLRLVAFHKVFDQSEMGGEIAKYLRQSIQGNVPQMLHQMVGSYLEIQNNTASNSQAKISVSNFSFRHRMMQYAVLCTETDKALLIAHCPIGFLVDVIAQMTNMREISFENEKRGIAKRFIQEILTGKHVASVVFHKIWNSEEFLEDFKKEWETVEWQPIVPNLMSDCKANFLYLAVFNKSPKLLDFILKTCEEQNFKFCPLVIKNAIFATCVIGHFEHFKLLMERIKDVDRFCQTEFKECVLIPRRNSESSEIDFDETKCYRYITHTAVAFNRLDILDYLKRCGQNVNNTDSQGRTSLYVACRYGSGMGILEYLKENNGDVANVTDKHGNTCLHVACCRYDNIKIVTWLVKDFPNLVLKRNTEGQTPLHTAVGIGNTQIVELLIDISNKFQENCLLEKDSSGRTVLHLACEIHNNLQMVIFLLERQPSLITIKDNYGNTALHYGSIEIGCTVLHFACKFHNVQMVNFVLQRQPSLIDVQDNDGDTALHVACFYGNIEIVTWLVNDYPNLVLKRNTVGQMPFHRAVQSGETKIVELLIEISRFQEKFVLEKDSSGCTGLHMACKVHNNLQIVELLLERQPSLLNIEDDDGKTALHYACVFGSIDIVTWLVKDYPNLVLKRNTVGQTPLHAAVQSGETQIVELLIQISNKFQENCLLEKDSSGCTVLHLACEIHNNLQMVIFLLERQPSLITIEDDYGNTALDYGSIEIGCTVLHFACKFHNVQMVNFVLQRQPSLIDVQDHDGNTALHVACFYGNIEIVTWLVNDYPNLVLKRNTVGQMPFHRAVQSGETKIVELLIELSNKLQEKFVLEKDSSGCTGLHMACKVHNNLQIVELLLERQPSLINIEDDDGKTALHYACFFGNIKIVTWLVKSFPNLLLKRNTVGQTPLHAAVQSGETQIVELLIQISDKLQEKFVLEKDSTGCTVLHLACKVHENLQMVKLLLERQPSLINIDDNHGNTALHVACFSGNIEIVTSLVKDFPNLVLKRNTAGRTPLHIAVEGGNKTIVELLIEISNKFQENFLLEKDTYGRKLLHLAICYKHLEIVNLLLQRQPSLINIEDHHGNTALHVACFYGNIEIVTWLVKDFPNLVLKRNTVGQTPLHTAVGIGNTQIVELLIKFSNKFQENCLLEKDSSGCTVLHLACEVHDNLHMVEFLLERQPSLINIEDHDGNTALHYACFFGSIDIVTGLVHDYPNLVLERNTAGQTPLHRAVKGSESEIAKILIEISKKFQENFLLEKDSTGRTVLHWACVKDHDNLPMVKFLLERQPSLINIQDNHGNTALHVSCQRTNKIKVVEFLVSKGMDINIANNSLRTSLHTACKAENVEVVQLLLEKENIQITKDKDNKYPYQLTKNKSVLDKFVQMGYYR